MRLRVAKKLLVRTWTRHDGPYTDGQGNRAYYVLARAARRGARFKGETKEYAVRGHIIPTDVRGTSMLIDDLLRD